MSRDRTIARPYAKAIFELAHASDAMAEWGDMLALASEIAANPQVMAMMKDPNFSLEDRINVFLTIGEKVFTPNMRSFIQLLGKFNRLLLLPCIGVMYDEMRAQAERLIVVKMTSAFAMDQAEQQEFAEKLKQRMHANILLECETDRSIIGGAIIQAGDVVIDGSIRGRLNKLADSMGILN
jgi:F-type H+-transporting ATPase subunit delta